MAVERQQKVRKPMASPADNATPPIQRGRGFFHEVIAELKKTTWPTPKEAWRLTSVVLGVIFTMAVYIGAIDYLLSWITKRFHLIP